MMQGKIMWIAGVCLHLSRSCTLLMCLGLMFIMAGRLPASDEAEQEKPNFLDLQHAVALMMDAPIARHKETRVEIETVRDRVEEFQGLVQEAGLSSEEQATLQHLTEVLHEIASTSEIESKEALDDVRRDLDLKIQYFHSRMGVVGTARGLVKVTVRTLRQGESVMGLIVYCNPYRWRNATRPMQTFPTLSSPTDAAMLPGYYRCFASEGEATRSLADRDVAIGLDGKDSLTLDIVVPK